MTGEGTSYEAIPETEMCFDKQRWSLGSPWLYLFLSMRGFQWTNLNCRNFPACENMCRIGKCHWVELASWVTFSLDLPGSLPSLSCFTLQSLKPRKKTRKKRKSNTLGQLGREQTNAHVLTTFGEQLYPGVGDFLNQSCILQMIHQLQGFQAFPQEMGSRDIHQNRTEEI